MLEDVVGKLLVEEERAAFMLHFSRVRVLETANSVGI
jgi:hypothetical protein